MTEEKARKWVGRSRHWWAAALVILLAVKGQAAALGFELPENIVESLDRFVQSIIGEGGLAEVVLGAVTAGLIAWSKLRPDDAKSTILPKATNAQIGKVAPMLLLAILVGLGTGCVSVEIPTLVTMTDGSQVVAPLKVRSPGAVCMTQDDKGLLLSVDPRSDYGTVRQAGILGAAAGTVFGATAQPQDPREKPHDTCGFMFEGGGGQEKPNVLEIPVDLPAEDLEAIRDMIDEASGGPGTGG